MTEKEMYKIYLNVLWEALEHIQTTVSTERYLSRAKIVCRALQEVLVDGKSLNMATFDFLYKFSK